MATDTLPKRLTSTREKVVLKPGFHLADWLRIMKTSSTDFSGRKGGPPLKITKQELAMHNTKFDCWTSYNGKVYNVTNYLPYHPGGEKQLMLGAGKDCTGLFNKYHAWVNIDSMLSKCYIGTLAVEKDPAFNESDENEDHSEAHLTKSVSSGVASSVDELSVSLEAQKLLDSDETDSTTK